MSFYRKYKTELLRTTKHSRVLHRTTKVKILGNASSPAQSDGGCFRWDDNPRLNKKDGWWMFQVWDLAHGFGQTGFSLHCTLIFFLTRWYSPSIFPISDVFHQRDHPMYHGIFTKKWHIWDLKTCESSENRIRFLLGHQESQPKPTPKTIVFSMEWHGALRSGHETNGFH